MTMSEVKPFAFVLMPFDREFDDIYKYGIKNSAEELDIIAERVDEQHFSETILERVYRQIDNSDFIVADMTGKNANVFYEVGYAHAKGKLCALLTQNVDDIPFDLKHHTHVVYDGSASDLTLKLKPKLEWLKGETSKRNEKRLVVSCSAGSGYLDRSVLVHKGQFSLELILRNETSLKSPEIEAYYVVTSPAWRLIYQGSECPFDDSTRGDGKKIRKHLINPNIRRLAPSAFEKIKLEFERTLWTKWSGDEERETYSSKGNIEIEVVTSEGTFPHEHSLEVSFDEIPF